MRGPPVTREVSDPSEKVPVAKSPITATTAAINPAIAAIQAGPTWFSLLQNVGAVSALGGGSGGMLTMLRRFSRMKVPAKSLAFPVEQALLPSGQVQSVRWLQGPHVSGPRCVSGPARSGATMANAATS